MDDTARKCGETLNNAIKVQEKLLARIRELEEAMEKIADEGSGWAVVIARAALNAKSPADQ